MFSLKGKTAIVTGSTYGIGLGILKIFGFGFARCRKCHGPAVRFDYCTLDTQNPRVPLVEGERLWCLCHTGHTSEGLHHR